VVSFWVATPRQLYRELDRIAADGLIQSRVLHHERRRRGDMRAVRDSVAKRL
jgi:DNA-binding PadR family transcriptional regulator